MTESIAVIIATRGRAGLVNELVTSLALQSRRPDAVFVVGSCGEDVAGLEQENNVSCKVGRAGLTRQRNDGLAMAGGAFDHLVFFDDDFVPSRFWIERAVELFKENPDLIALTGAVLADGVKAAGIALEAGRGIVRQRDEAPTSGAGLRDGFGPYGCNMAFRYSAIADIAFDERLPLYGWLEDADFGGRIRRRGRLAKAEDLWGVHLGHKSGRARGVTLGYSQIANVIYLARKGTLPIAFLAKIAIGNLLANLLRALRPELYVDRRGRLLGNLMALGDVLLRGRVTPERAAEL